MPLKPLLRSFESSELSVEQMLFFNFISGKFRFSLFKISARKWTGLSCYGLALCARYFFFIGIVPVTLNYS